MHALNYQTFGQNDSLKICYQISHDGNHNKNCNFGLFL